MTERAPAGVITLVFTDIQGSSALWEKLGESFRPVLDRHNSLLRDLIDRCDGYEVKTQGDSFMVAFSRAEDALRWAVEVQKSLSREPWPDTVGDLRVRIGMHTGEPLLGHDPAGRADYFGPVVNRAARVSSAGHGGQTLISSATREVVQTLELPVELRDLGRHRLRGLDQPEELYQVDIGELPSREFPPLKTLETVRTNLPAQPATFVGRQEELSELRRLLKRESTRLVTLVGFGGMGKTRTAMQLAELSIDEHEDGVWWVELDQTRSGSRIFDRIAYDLRLHLLPQPSVKEQVLAYLHPRKLVLFLDNAEQIPDAASAIHEILNEAPGVRCVVTSRKALELPVEILVEIGPLPQAEAERLFVERARTRQTDFRATAENAQDIAELCLGLEGVPLAIELAASRIVGMTPREILSRLDARFRVLQTRAPDLPARQRALRGAIDWSYELLSEDDQPLFAELSVFAGGFTMEDAEAVSEAFDVFEGVMELRRHSLLRAETQAATQRTRYSMLDSVREYAAEKLEESPGQAEALKRRHSAYFLRFAEERAARMRTCDEPAALDDLGTALDNIRAAVRWARDAGEGLTCARLTLAFFHLLYCRGFWDQAQHLLETGLEALGTASGDTRHLRADIERSLASVFVDTGNLERARELAQANLSRHRELGDTAGTADALSLLGLIAFHQGRYEECLEHLKGALELVGAGNNSLRGIVLHNLALLASKQGQCDEAQRLYEEALDFRRRAGHLRGEAETLGNLGVLAHLAGNLEEARLRYQESIALHKRLGDRHGAAIILNNLGELCEAQGDLEAAALFFFHAERIFRDLQSPHVRTTSDFLEGLARRMPPEQWEQVRDRAARSNWQELV